MEQGVGTEIGNKDAKRPGRDSGHGSVRICETVGTFSMLQAHSISG